MLSASTQAREDLIIRQLLSSNSKAELSLEYDTDGSWNILEDLDVQKGVDWDESSKNYKYANWSLVPLASQIKFSVLNIDGKYSPGSGEAEAGVFDLDTKVRLRAGYLIQDDSELSITDETLDIDGSDAFNYYMKYNAGGYVELDVDNTDGGTDIYFNDLFPLLGEHAYGSVNYAYTGYFLITKDFSYRRHYKLKQISVTTNTTTGNIYYRTFNDLTLTEAEHNDSTDWIDGGATSGGTDEIAYNSEDRYIQIAIVIDTPSWDDDIRISDVSIQYLSQIEWIYTNVYYLDSPSYTDPKQPEIPRINCQGRDIWKRALETEINVQDMSGGVELDQLVKDICDRIGVGYTATSIADLSAFDARTLATGWASDDNIKEGSLPKAGQIFDGVMQLINSTITGNSGSDRYWMYSQYDSTTDDNVLYLQQKPAVTSADLVLAYQNYDSLGDKRKNYDKVLKRLTVISEAQVPDAEEQLATDDYIAAQTNQTLSWAGNAEHKRITAVNNGSSDATFTLDEVTPTNIQFDITAGSNPIDMTVTVFGSKWSSDPAYEGEAINYSNMASGRGLTARIVNPMVLSDTECKAMAEFFMNDFNDPSFEANQVKWPYLYLFPQINNTALLWSRWTYTDDIFFIQVINHHWDINRDFTAWNLEDSGSDFSDVGTFNYDDVMEYEGGWVYDMALGVGTSADDAETQSIALAEYDIGVGT